MNKKTEEWKSAHLKYSDLYRIKKVSKSFFLVRKRNPVCRTIHKLSKGNKLSILEAGCGSGADSICLALSRHKVLGLDISSYIVNEAQSLAGKAEKMFKRKIDVNFKTGDVFNLSKYTKKFDVVFNVAVIQMWKTEEERLKILNNMKNCLKKNGKLVIAATNTTNIFLKLVPKKELVSDRCRYNLNVLKNEVEKTGLKVISEGSLGLSETFDQWIKFKFLKYPLMFLNSVFYISPNVIKKLCAPHSFVVATKIDTKI